MRYFLISVFFSFSLMQNAEAQFHIGEEVDFLGFNVEGTQALLKSTFPRGDEDDKCKILDLHTKQEKELTWKTCKKELAKFPNKGTRRQDLPPCLTRATKWTNFKANQVKNSKTTLWIFHKLVENPVTVFRFTPMLVITHNSDEEMGEALCNLEASHCSLQSKFKDCQALQKSKSPIMEGAPTSVQSCRLVFATKRCLAIYTAVAECGGDSCSSVSYLITEEYRAPKLPVSLDGHWIFTPNEDGLLFDSMKSEPGKTKIILERMDFEAMRVKEFADCFSPTLTPQRDSILCRNQNGDVLKLSLAGKILGTIWKSPADQKFEWVPGAWIYPEPVSFPNATTLHIPDGVDIPWTK